MKKPAMCGRNVHYVMRQNNFCSPSIKSGPKFQAPVYDIRPPTTAINGYATGLGETVS